MCWKLLRDRFIWDFFSLLISSWKCHWMRWCQACTQGKKMVDWSYKINKCYKASCLTETVQKLNQTLYWYLTHLQSAYLTSNTFYVPINLMFIPSQSLESQGLNTSCWLYAFSPEVQNICVFYLESSCSLLPSPPTQFLTRGCWGGSEGLGWLSHSSKLICSMSQLLKSYQQTQQ